MELEGIIFDLDGTVVEAPYDWPEIKDVLETQGRPILHYLQDLKDPERSEKWRILERYERDATTRARLKEGVPELLAFLALNRVKIALVTNNSSENTSYLLAKFSLKFDLVITRESGLWKPSGAPVAAAMKRLELEPRFCAAIGDSTFDVTAANEAGITRIFIISRDKDRFPASRARIFSSIQEIRRELETLVRSGTD